MKKFINKFEKQLMEVSLTTVGGGLNTGDAWPDGIFTRYGERRHIGPAGMPRGMTQIVAPASDVIYGGDGSQIPEPDLGGGTFKRTKITPALVATNAVLDPWKDLRSDEPPLTPNQRVYGRRAFGKSPQYTIPRESADFVFTGGDKEQDILVKPTTPPEGNMQHGNDIAHTPEPGSKALGSKSGYRQVQKGGESILHDLDKLYIDKMLGKYDPKKEGISEGSLPTKVKQVKKTKGVKPPNAKKAKQFFQHHVVHNGPHIKGQGAEHATYDFDDDDYEVDGGLQKRKDKQKRGYEPVESVKEASSYGAQMLLGGLAQVIKKAGMKPKTAKMMGGGFKVSKRDKVGFKMDVEIRGRDKKQTHKLQFEMERGMLYVVIKNKPVKLGKYTMVNSTAQNLKKVGAALMGSKGKPVRIA